MAILGNPSDLVLDIKRLGVESVEQIDRILPGIVKINHEIRCDIG